MNHRIPLTIFKSIVEPVTKELVVSVHSRAIDLGQKELHYHRICNGVMWIVTGHLISEHFPWSFE